MKKLPSKYTWMRVSVFAIAAVVVALFMPRPDRVNFSYEVNRPWAHPQLLAPFDVPIYRDALTKQLLIDSIQQQFVPVFMYDNAPVEKIKVTVQSDKDLTAADKDFILHEIERIYSHGIVDQAIADRINQGELTAIKIHAENTRRTTPTSKMISSKRAYIFLDSIVAARRPSFIEPFRRLNLSNYIIPNVVENTEETAQMLNEMLQPIEAGIGIIQQGERIIDRGDIVTPQLYQILLTYEQELNKRADSSGRTRLNTILGQILFCLVIFGAFYTYLYFYRPAELRNIGRAICMLCLMAVFFIIGVVMHRQFVSGLYIVPFAILPIVVVVFYDTSIAMFVLLLEVLLCAAYATFPLEFIFVEMIAGFTAIFSTKELSKRSQLLRTSLLVFLAYVVSYCAVELMQVATLNSFSWRLIGYFALNMVLTSFAYILIFVVEKIFGFISVVTLVELSDINSPLLREFSVECPGSFQHSMTVSNLVSHAAHLIGANVQLARAGALYHDIGKMKNPAFFTENQHGVNPHDSLTPKQSARVIISHVTDGLKRAEKENLPKVIRDMILQHHGKSTTRYFYAAYCKAHPDETVDPAPFTYPGPNPQTKEASLLMMADVVEAASRSLPDHSQEKITEMVNRLIDAQVAEGLHRDSALSFRDITTIKKAFIDSLTTMYHVRIAYPK